MGLNILHSHFQDLEKNKFCKTAESLYVYHLYLVKVVFFVFRNICVAILQFHKVFRE